MEKSLSENLQQTARGSLILMIGYFSSTILQAITAIIVARFLGSFYYGQLTVAMIPIAVASLFNDPGVKSGLIKYIAQFRSENRLGDTKKLIISGLMVNSIISSVLVMIIFFSSGYLAKNIFNQPEIQLLIQFASINILAVSLVSTTKAVFIGFERMEFVSVLDIVQSILRSVLAPLLVFFGFGVLGAVIGNSSSILITGLLGLIFTLTIFLRMATTEQTLRYRQSSKLLIQYGLPLFLSTLLTGGVLQLYKILMALHVDTFSIGNYQAATNFSVIVTFFTMPISTVLFPLFSKFSDQQNRELSLVYQNSIKYASIITIPVVTTLILFAEPIVKILYGGGYPHTAFYLKLYCINFLFIGLGRNCHANLIKGQGYPEVIFQNKVIDAIIGIPLSLLLIARFGIIGLIFSTMLSSKISLFRSILWIYRKFGFTLMWESSVKIYLSSVVSFLSTYYVLKILDLNEMYELIIGEILFFFLYLILIIIFKTLDSSDIVDLRKILSTMGPFTRLFNIFLNILEKFLI